MIKNLLFVFSFAIVHFCAGQKDRFVVFLDGETNELLENVTVASSFENAIVTQNNHVTRITGFRKSYVFAANAEGYHSELLTDENLPEKGDTASIHLIPTEELMESRWKQNDSSILKRDTLPDFTALQAWIRKHFKVSPASQNYCGESLCSYGRTFKVNIMFDLTSEEYFIPAGIDTRYADVKCKYVERDVERLMRSMPLVKADKLPAAGHKMAMPLTVSL